MSTTVYTYNDKVLVNSANDKWLKKKEPAAYDITYTPSSDSFIYPSGPAQAAAGDTVTLSYTSAMPGFIDIGYYTVDGVQIEGNTFTMPAHAVTVSAATAGSGGFGGGGGFDFGGGGFGGL